MMLSGKLYLVEGLGYGINKHDEDTPMLMVSEEDEAEIAETLGSSDKTEHFFFGMGFYKGELAIFFVIENREMNFLIPLGPDPDPLFKFFDMIIETDRLGIATLGDDIGTFWRENMKIPAKSFMEEWLKFLEVS